MAISRSQLVRELEPGLNALFGLEYSNYENEHAEIYDVETSDRAFEEEVMLSGFGNAPVKSEGAGVAYDNAQEVYAARYTHETIALAFALTEEAVEDNLYDRLSARYTRSLARSMAQTKQIKAAAVLNGAFTTSIGGDGKPLCATDHPTLTGADLKNELTTPADLSETSLEQALIDIAAFTDERGLKIAIQGLKLIIPKELQFTADRIMKSTLRVGTADNDINAIKNMGMIVSVIRLGSRIHAVSLVHRVDVVRKGGCKTPLLLYSLRTRIYSAHTTGLADVIETYGQCAITRKVYHG